MAFGAQQTIVKFKTFFFTIQAPISPPEVIFSIENVYYSMIYRVYVR